MLQGFEPSRKTVCLLCRRAASRYYGHWAEEGLCRTCVEKMAPELRLRILQDMNPEDRKRWQIDNLYGMEARAGRPERGGRGRLEDALVRAPPDPRPPRPRPPPSDRLPETARPERRRHQRVAARLPTSLSVPATATGRAGTRARGFHALSRDVSVGGIRVASQDAALLDFRCGSLLRVELLLPSPSLILRCAATVRSAAPSREASGGSVLGLSFQDLNLGQEAALRQFLAAGAPA